MKLSQKPKVRPQHSPLLSIINVHTPEELNLIINSILSDPDKNTLHVVDHYIFIGNIFLIAPIISKITDFYDIQWCGEYCIASYTNTANQYARYVPVASLKTGPMQSLEIHLKDLKILYVPKITNLSYILDFLKLLKVDTSELDMICSTNTKYEGGDCQEWLHFEDHDENEAGVHYFVPDRNIERLNDEVIKIRPFKSFTECIIHIVDTNVEQLEHCWRLEMDFLEVKL